MRFLKRILLCAALSTYTAWAQDSDRPSVVITATDEWRPVDMSSPWPIAGSALDMSSLVENEPVGTFGRVIRTPDGHFAFEKRPQQRVDFFGCSISTELSFTPTRLSSKADIEAYAERIRRQGYNLVRPHFLDHALTRSATQDLEFNPDILDRFDYFVKCLKDRGIYLYLDAVTSWKGYTKAPAWTPEATAVDLKSRMYGDPAAKAHWESGVRQLLTHLNPYTKTRLADDPVVAVLLFFNEQEINAWAKIPPIIEAPWREYLRKKYGTIEALQAAWQSDKGEPLTQAASFEAIPLFTTLSLSEKNQRGVDVESFMTQIETDLVQWYIERVREMGYKGLVSQYDYLQNLRYAVPRNLTDVVSMHGYFAHPSNYTSPGSKISQESAVGSAANWFRGMAATRFGDRPFLLTEYGQVYWNRYRYEEGLMLGAYSALQNYDCLMAHSEPVTITPSLIKPFNVNMDPIARASQVVSGFLFARRDVQAASHYVNLEVRPQELYNVDNIHNGVNSEQGRLALMTGFGISYTGNKAPTGIVPRRADVTLHAGSGAQVSATNAFATMVDSAGGKFNAAEFVGGLKKSGILPAGNRTDVARGVYESETGQIFLDAESKLMTVRAPRVEGASFENLKVPLNLGAVTVASSSVSANVTVIALDGANLGVSRRLLIVYATDALNSDSEFDKDDRTVLRSIGKVPVLMRTGEMKLSLTNPNSARLKGWALGMDGSRKEALPLSVQNGVLSVVLNTRTLANGPTPFFEIAEN